MGITLLPKTRTTKTTHANIWQAPATPTNHTFRSTSNGRQHTMGQSAHITPASENPNKSTDRVSRGRVRCDSTNPPNVRTDQNKPSSSVPPAAARSECGEDSRFLGCADDVDVVPCAHPWAALSNTREEEDHDDDGDDDDAEGPSRWW